MQFIKSIIVTLLIVLPGCFTMYAQEVTFNKDIAPLIHRSCTPCHRPGESGPFSLITYEDVAKRASFIKTVTRNRYMPPWKPDVHDTLFINNRKLSEKEIQVIATWVNNKMPRGENRKNTTIPIPSFNTGTQYNRLPDLVLKMQRPFLIKGDNMERFIVFKIPYELPDSANVEAVEFISANKKLVHHANFAICAAPEKEDIHAGDDFINVTEDDRSKYIQYDAFQKNMVYYGGWIPGAAYESYPKGMGWVMPRKGVILLTMHYAPQGKEEQDISGLNLFFTKSTIKRKINLISIGSGGIGEKDIDPYFFIPAEKIKTFQVKVVTPGMDQSVLYVWPHMHLLGKKFRAYAVSPKGDTIQLVTIPEWDFNWQELYRFKHLVKIPQGSVLTVEGSYDNTSNNPNNPFHPPQTIYSSGDMKSTDEMLTLVMLTFPYQKGDETLELVQP
ncbi:c-type cytochrome [Chitinophaga defluvii]|uniref:Cytochrome c n=1 Tax=Chitinophaga defluvii TaxID=3163343 RepID=A0ABV2TCB4_9BACT